jgi:hypothetical protein
MLNVRFIFPILNFIHIARVDQSKDERAIKFNGHANGTQQHGSHHDMSGSKNSTHFSNTGFDGNKKNTGG